MTSARCKNCGTAVLGRYCAHCGQAADVHVPTTAELAHEVLEGLTHSDSRLWRTLTALWLKPGGLTQEFVAGRRVAYLPPFRLYLVLSVLFFVIASVSHSDGEATPLNLSQGSPASRIARCDGINFESFGQHPDLNQRIQQACKSIMRDNGANLQHLALATLSKAMFIFLPLVAFLNMLLYWRPKYRYAEQLLFIVHLHAFFFSAAIVMLAATNAEYFWPKLRGSSDVVETLLGWTVSVYTVIAVRRVFARSWTGALFKALALACIYLTVFALTVGGVFLYALLQL